MPDKSRFRPSPAMVVALIALFVAMSGSAVALSGSNTVNSGDIINGQVKSPDIATGHVRSGDLGNSSVTTAKISDGAVTGGDLGDQSVGAEKLRCPYSKIGDTCYWDNPFDEGTFKEAYETCASYGMRVPTLSETLNIIDDAPTPTLGQPDLVYWTASPYSPTFMFMVRKTSTTVTWETESITEVHQFRCASAQVAE